MLLLVVRYRCEEKGLKKSMKMAAAIIQREQRAKTQPQPAKANDQANTSHSRRATYHINDGTHSSMEEEDSNLTNSSSRDSGLSSQTSLTPSIRLDPAFTQPHVNDETRETETKNRTNEEHTSLPQVNDS